LGDTESEEVEHEAEAEDDANVPHVGDYVHCLPILLVCSCEWGLG